MAKKSDIISSSSGLGRVMDLDMPGMVEDREALIMKYYFLFVKIK
eukprot:CAMPEP_0194325072 /NCGR_PEP_ID=MMETSP0171-20130528/29025_1 /TAXON_ID=218684 /ORGANISM="Corethron pennatum, Strain L29A3" /LENGTH=44 /DNA_ID= /DNA_START= /DNA_END= /DNA_ORIENTATION=